jgi:hypothetical protein
MVFILEDLVKIEADRGITAFSSPYGRWDYTYTQMTEHIKDSGKAGVLLMDFCLRLAGEFNDMGKMQYGPEFDLYPLRELAEAVTNAFQHGNNDTIWSEINIEYKFGSKGATILVRDQGLKPYPLDIMEHFLNGKPYGGRIGGGSKWLSKSEFEICYQGDGILSLSTPIISDLSGGLISKDISAAH